MKNITALTVLVTIICFFFTVNFAFSDTAGRNYIFSIGPQAGFVYGQALELVFSVPGDTKGELLSELKWDMKPVFYTGLQMEFSRADITRAAGFFSLLSFKAGFPKDSGIIENRDWMSTENGELTHFSSHTNRTRLFFLLDTSIGVSLPVGPVFYVKPFISGSWMHFAFTGRNGSGQYARVKTSFPVTYHPIDDNPFLYTFENEVIRYNQNWFSIAPGLALGANVFSSFFLEIFFKASPLTYCTAMDEHLTTDAVYKDYISGGFFLEPGGRFSFIKGRFEFSFNFSYRHIGTSKGDSYINRYNSSYWISPNKAGAGLGMADSCFLVKIRI